MKSTKKVLFTSFATIGMSLALIGGSTFALFTSESKTNIAVTSGKVAVTATAELKEVWSTDWNKEADAYVKTDNLLKDGETSANFSNSGMASAENGVVTLDRVTPGDGVKVRVDIENESDVAIQYRVYTTSGADDGLFAGLKIAQTGAGTEWVSVPAGEELTVAVELTIELPLDAGNMYQGKSCEIVVCVEAIQGNAKTEDFVVEKDGTIIVLGEEALGYINELVEGEEEVNVKLGADIDLSEVEEFKPIGSKEEKKFFTGTFDGAGHTIRGLDIDEGDAYRALFGAVKDATIKNLTVEGKVTASDAAGIAARVEGEVVFENCTNRVEVTGTTKAGGIACNVTGANAQFINCVNEGNITYNRAAAGGAGGIVGYVNGDATAEIIDCVNHGNIGGTGSPLYLGAAVGYANANCTGYVANFTNDGEITGGSIDISGGRYLKDADGTILCGYCGAGMWKTPTKVSSTGALQDALTAEGGIRVVELSAGTYDAINMSTVAEIKNATIIGGEGVKMEGFTFSTANRNTNGDTSENKIDGLTFKNITFTKTVYLATSSAKSYISNVTFENCVFDLGDTKSPSAQGIRYYNENNNGNVSGLTVIGCEFRNCYQGIYTHHVQNVTVSGCTFDTTKHNAIAFQGQEKNGDVQFGTITITNNTFANIGDRIFRFANIGADSTIIITGNVATNSGDDAGEISKAQSCAQGATIEIKDNDWGNGVVPNDTVNFKK